MRATQDAAEATGVRLGGAVATAEAAWMGVPQATEVLDVAHLPQGAGARPSVGARLSALLNREFSVAEATVLLMASFLVSAALGAVRQVLLNARFGTGPQASAYYAAFRLPDALFSLIAGGALSSAFIPVLIATRRSDGEAAAWRLTSLVLHTLLVGVAVVSALLALGAPWFVDRLLVPGFDPATRELTATLTRVMLLQPLILVVGSVATAVLNSRNRFLLTALSVASHNIALIGGVAAAAAVPRLGIYGPTLGVVAGALLQVLILLPGVLGSGQRYMPAWDLRDPRLREVGRLLLPNGLAVGVGYIGFIADTAFASRAREPASLAAIQNAFLLVGLPTALFGQAAGQAAFPRLAAHATAGEYQTLHRVLLRTMAVMVGLAVVAVAGMALLGRLTIRVLFEHGDFTAADGDLTARVLFAYSAGLPAYVATEVLVRALIALRAPQIQLYSNSAQLLVRAGLAAVLLGALDTRAIPLAFAVSAALETCALLIITLHRLRRLAVPARSSALP